MGKTVDRMLKSAGLDTKTGISTVEGDEDHNLTVTISFITSCTIDLFINIVHDVC